MGFAIEIRPDNSDVRLAIQSNLEDLFKPHKPGDDILISQVREAISNSGVSDFNLTELYADGVPFDTNSNVDLSGYMYPMVDFINFTELV